MDKNVRISSDTHKKLKVYSAETGSSISEIITQAVNEFIQTVPTNSTKEDIDNVIGTNNASLGVPSETATGKVIKSIAAKKFGDGFVPEEVTVKFSSEGFEMCKHGSKLGLCKHGCK